jgi:integrase
MLRWTDPTTHERKHKSAGTRNRREAERAAAVLEKQLHAGAAANSPRMLWADFCLKYTEMELPGKSASTAKHVLSVFHHLERIVAPKRLGDVNEAALLCWQQSLRGEGRSPATIASYRGHLHAILEWAVRQKLLPRLPAFPDPPRLAKGESPAKGRAILREEAERMLTNTAKVVGKPAARSWRRLLIGLWQSGLRLGEAVALDWYEPGARGFCVDLSGRRPMFIVSGDAEKAGRNRLLPMAPEFARWLEKVPETERRGKVFPLLRPKEGKGSRGDGPVSLDTASQVVCAIGKAAGVVVARKVRWDREQSKPVERVKHASAHDFRRAFCFRWALRVVPAVLKVLARHASIQTTEKYYIGQNAEATADAAWSAWEAARGNAKAARRKARRTRERGPIAGGAKRQHFQQQQPISTQGGATGESSEALAPQELAPAGGEGCESSAV